MYGGLTSKTFTCTNDVWSSDDGVTWSKVLDKAPWFARHELLGHVFNNKMWVINGAPGINVEGIIPDVWSSEDGKTWVQATASIGAQFGKLAGMAIASCPQYMIITGGNEPAGDKQSNNRVWYSKDGVSWLQSQTPPWQARSHHCMLYFKDKIWLFQGAGGTTQPIAFSDVWCHENETGIAHKNKSQHVSNIIIHSVANTTIRYSVPYSGTILFSLLNSTGRELMRVHNTIHHPGLYTFDLNTYELFQDKVSNGLYILTISGTDHGTVSHLVLKQF